MNIGIIGFGREGKIAYEYWKEKADKFFIYDQNEKLVLPEICEGRLGKDYKNFLLEDQGKLDLIVKSPGVPILDIESKISVPVTTITKEFFAKCPCKIIGVTGTKGKGTTASLIYDILKDAAKDVYLVGNIGVPALTVLERLNKDSIVVYELSSFQLYDLNKSPQIAICLLVTEDHLDWHETVSHYQNSKENIFKYQKEEDTAIWYKDNEVTNRLAKISSAKNKISFGANGDVRVENGQYYFKDEHICSLGDVVLVGAHNQQNICAAIAATFNLVSKESIVNVLKSFSGLPYHIEDKGLKGGIRFINDSFSVNPTSTIVAIESFVKSIILMLGGVDRGLHLESLVEKILNSKNLKQVILYGKFGERLSKEFEKNNFTNFVFIESQNFQEIFEKSVSFAIPGDIILFSPAAPSFDMFENYIKRGEKFNELYQNI